MSEEEKDPALFTKEEAEGFFAFVYAVLKVSGHANGGGRHADADEAYLNVRKELLPDSIPYGGVQFDHPLHLDRYIDWLKTHAEGGCT